MSFDFLARKILLHLSVVFNDVGTVAIAGYFLCGGRRHKDSFEGLQEMRSLRSYLCIMNLDQQLAFEETLLEIILIGSISCI
jgi:hypothetical protein